MSATENQTKVKKEFLNYINVFRGLAILLIIAGHTMQLGEPNSVLHKINCEIICGGTTLFIFISGFLFQHLSANFEYTKYLQKKWTNVVMPYLLTSILGIIFCLILPNTYGNSFDGLPILIQIPIFLTTGRIHNTPTWFILMIILFFFSAKWLINLDRNNKLYKFLPLMFLVTIIFRRVDVDYNSIAELSYINKYLSCIFYILNGFIHFFSIYVFGMFCSKHKDIIDKFYSKRYFLLFLIIISAAADVYLSSKNLYSSFTIAKTFLTMLVLGYLKHYDSIIMSKPVLNNCLDTIAKYSFGLFFVHWYVFFIYNQIFGLTNVVIPYDNLALTILTVFIRFIAVSSFSMLILFAIKKLINKINKNSNTRMFLGI